MKARGEVGYVVIELNLGTITNIRSSKKGGASTEESVDHKLIGVELRLSLDRAEVAAAILGLNSPEEGQIQIRIIEAGDVPIDALKTMLSKEGMFQRALEQARKLTLEDARTIARVYSAVPGGPGVPEDPDY